MVLSKDRLCSIFLILEIDILVLLNPLFYESNILISSNLFFYGLVPITQYLGDLPLVLPKVADVSQNIMTNTGYT